MVLLRSLFIACSLLVFINTQAISQVAQCECQPKQFVHTQDALRPYFEAAPTVFYGRAIAADLVANDSLVAYTFAVEHSWKGISDSVAYVLADLPQRSCAYYFRMGVKYLVFTSSTQQGDSLFATKCSQTRELGGYISPNDMQLLERFAETKTWK